MRRRDDSDIEWRQRAISTDTLNLAGLQESQEHRLHAQAHLADFVHEDRALVGRFEPSALVAIRAGEAATHVAEELGLEKCVGEAGTVHRDERRTGSLTLLVNEPRHELLPDTAFSRDQHLRPAAACHCNLPLDGAHRCTGAEHRGGLHGHNLRSSEIAHSLFGC